MSEDEASTSVAKGPLDYVALVVAAAAAALMLAGAAAAFAFADIRRVDGTERFRLLAQAASPSVAAFALAAVAIVVHERRRARVTQVAAGVALGLGAAVALVAALLALNGMVVDITQQGTTGLFRLSNVLGRLATVSLCGLTLWLAATAPAARASGPARPESPPVADPPPSPPGAPDPSSPG